MRKGFKHFITGILALAMGIACVPAVPASAQGLRYKDVPKTAWFFDSVDYASELGVTFGTHPDRFSPNETLTRAMFTTMLYRLAGSPAVSTTETSFTDVLPGTYYTQAVAWATQNQLLFPTDSEQFLPNVDITREQIAYMIAQYAARIDARFLSEEYHVEQFFADADETSDFAKESMTLMVYRGIFLGYGKGIFRPRQNATRAEASTLICRLALMLDKVPAAGVLLCDGQKMTLSNSDTVRLYRLLHNKVWIPTEYAEYEPCYSLTLWGTEYRFADAPTSYNGFNVVSADHSYSGMVGKDEDTKLDLELIFDILDSYTIAD